MTGRALARARRARRRPAARGLAAHRRARASTTAARASLLAQDLDALEEQTQGFDGHVQGAGRRPVDAGRDGREAARRPGARRPRRPPRARAGAGRGAARPRRRRAPPAARGAELRRPGRRAGAARRARRAGPHRVRLPPAPHRSTRRRPRRRWRGSSPRSPTPAPSRAPTAAPPTSRSALLARCRRPGCRSTSTCSPRGLRRRGRRRSRQGRRVLLGVVPSTDPAAEPDRRSQVTERVLRFLDMLGLEPGRSSAWWSPRPAAWPAPRRAGPAGRSPVPGGARNLVLTPSREPRLTSTESGSCHAPAGCEPTAASGGTIRSVGGDQPTSTPSGPSVASSACLTFEEDPDDQRAAEHQRGADEERVGRAVGEGLDARRSAEPRHLLGARLRGTGLLSRRAGLGDLVAALGAEVHATVLRVASPSAPPTCCMVLSTPEAMPESRCATWCTAVSVIGTKVSPCRSTSAR